MNDYEFRVFGMRRSGNHYLVSWLLSSFGDEEVFYYNNIHSPLRITGRCVSHGRRIMGDYGSKLAKRNMYRKKNCDKKCIIQSYEDKYLNIVEKIDKQKIGKSKKVFNIMILRDPYNWIASRLQYLKRHPNVGALVTNKSKIKLWKQYAKEFLGETNILGDNKIVISYNRFCIDLEYRKEIADKLGIVPNMDNKTVLGFGGGSSFSYRKMETDRDEYLKRWKKYENSRKFISLTNDEELQELSKTIFGDIK